MKTSQQDELYTRPETAEYLKIKEQTLAAWASAGRGPRFVRVGRSVRYRRTDLDAWLEARTVTPSIPQD